MKVLFPLLFVIGSCLVAQAADPPTKNNIKVDEKAAWFLATDAADQPATVKAADPQTKTKEGEQKQATFTIVIDDAKPSAPPKDAAKKATARWIVTTDAAKQPATAKAAEPTVKKAVKLNGQVTGNMTLTLDAAKQPAIIRAADPTVKSDGKQEARITGNVTVASDAVVQSAEKPVKVSAFVENTKTDASPFKDKIVRVQALAANRTEIFTLENVKLTTLLGSQFITGTAVKYRNDRFSGTEVYLNLKNVLTIVAMTPEQAKKFNEAKPRRPSGQPQRGQGPFVPPQGPYMPGFNPQQPGQGPYFPQPGFNPQRPGFQFNPPQGYIPPQGFNPPQGGPGQNIPPQGFNPPQGGQGQNNPPQLPNNNPPQGGQPNRGQPHVERDDPESP